MHQIQNYSGLCPSDHRWEGLQHSSSPPSWWGWGSLSPFPRTLSPLWVLRASHSAYPHHTWRCLCLLVLSQSRDVSTLPLLVGPVKCHASVISNHADCPLGPPKLRY